MDKCIEFVGAKIDGYGVLKRQGKVIRAHRLAYVSANGITLDDISGKLVIHSCDNRACINPAHLSLGTDADNMADKVKKNRQAKGDDLPQSKLTSKDIEKIRKYLSKGYTNAGIAKIYGVSQMCISRVRNRRTWRHV